MKQKIKEIAIKLFMKYGIKSISMDDIAREAGCSKKTIYQNISDKKSLVHEALTEFLKEDQRLILKEINNKKHDAIEQMITIAKKGLDILRSIKPTVIFDLKKYHKDAWELVEKHHHGFMLKIIEQNIKQGISEGVYRESIDPKIISLLFVKKMNAMIDDDFIDYAHKPHYLFEQQLMYHLHGIVNQAHFDRLSILSLQSKQIEI